MELPNYRFPSARSVGQLIWEKARDFLQKGFHHYFCGHGADLVPADFDTRLNVAAPDASLLAAIGSFIAPVFAPLGFGDWRVTQRSSPALPPESVVSTLTVLLGGDTAHFPRCLPRSRPLYFGVYPAVYPAWPLWPPPSANLAAAKPPPGWL